MMWLELFQVTQNGIFTPKMVVRQGDVRCATVKLNVLHGASKKFEIFPKLKKNMLTPLIWCEGSCSGCEKTKLEACKKLFVSATQIFRRALQEEIPNAASRAALPRIDYTTRNFYYF